MIDWYDANKARPAADGDYLICSANNKCQVVYYNRFNDDFSHKDLSDLKGIEQNVKDVDYWAFINLPTEDQR